MPDMVVRPAALEEVAHVLKIAQDQRIPVTPVAAGTNGWAAHLPLKGGLVVDLSRLDRIVEINVDMRYMVVEPGVSIRRVCDALSSRGLSTSIPRACPAQASMLVNLLIQGMGSMTLRYGAQSELINGLEAVLADGTVLRCGSCAATPNWYARGPLPDLVGLFAGWYGASGIVTKISFPIHKKPLHMDAVCFAIERPNAADLPAFLSTLIDLDVADDISAYTQDVKFVGRDTRNRARRASLYVYAVVTGPSRRTVESKTAELTRAASNASVGGIRVLAVALSAQDRGDYLRLPNLIDDFESDQFGGSTNPCCHIPIVEWPKLMADIGELCRRDGRPRGFRLGVFRGSHYGSLMTYLRFRREDSGDVLKVRRLVRKIVEAYVSHGGLVWKAPPWAWKIQMAGGDPGFRSVLRAVKSVLDPNQILNPGRLELPSS